MMKGHVDLYRGKHRDSWYYRVYLGPDPRTGKKKYVMKSGFGTQEEAQAAMNLFMSERL